MTRGRIAQLIVHALNLYQSITGGVHDQISSSHSHVHRLLQISPVALTDAETDSLIRLLGAGGADDMGRRSLAALEAQVADLLPILRQAQIYPHQPSWRLQRLILHHGSVYDLDTMRASLRMWLAEPPDSIYSRAAGAVVRPSDCRILRRQIVAAEALVECKDPAADSLISALLERVDEECAHCTGRIPDRRYLELARLRMAGGGGESIMVAGAGDTLRCIRDLNAVRSAQLYASASSRTRSQGISLEFLGQVLDCLRCTRHAPSDAIRTRGNLQDAAIILILRFEDGLTVFLSPFDQDRVRYEDDSYCHGVYWELFDPRLNEFLHQLTSEVNARKLGPHARRLEAAR